MCLASRGCVGLGVVDHRSPFGEFTACVKALLNSVIACLLYWLQAVLRMVMECVY